MSTQLQAIAGTAVGRRDGKPTRAQRQERNRIMKKAVEVAEIAATAVPAAFRKSSGPQDAQVTGLQTAQERRQEQQAVRATTGPALGTGPGRPSEYTQEEADEICAWIQEGGSLRSYTKTTGRPSVTVYRWLREHTDFHARYAQAHEDRADTLTDEMVQIADDAALGATIEDVAAAKLRVETRKWIASKLRPQKWGDKQIVEHKGAVSIRLGIPQKAGQPAIDMGTAVEVLDARVVEPHQIEG